MKIRILDTEDCTCRPYNGKHDRVVNSNLGKRTMGITASIFCYDPYILALTQTQPIIAKVKEMYDEDADLLIVPHSNIPGAENLIQEKSQEGSALILVQPDSGLFNNLADLDPIEYKGEIISLNEKWIFDFHNANVYYHPNNLPVQLLLSKSLSPKSHIGEHPDLYINGKTAIFASDAFHAYEIYRNQIFTLVKDFSVAFVIAVRKVLGEAVNEKIISDMYEYFDLRRDFHSFGLAIYLLEQLAEKLDKEIDITQALELSVESAKELVNGEIDRSSQLLKEAFEILYTIRRELANLDVYLVESPHNGVLYDDMGFSEFGFPEWSAQFLNDLLNLSEKKNYKFNYECEARSISYSSTRLPKTTEKLRKLWNEGKIELVNGTYSQPYPLLYSLESNLRQFVYGLKVFNDVFGKKPEVYQQQEFGFTPQTPQLLAKMGLRYAVHRCLLQGDTPIGEVGLFRWKAPDGSGIIALSSDELKTELLGNNLFMYWPDLILKALKMELKQVVFTNFSDFGSNPYFREECARIAYYAPILGEYCTFSEVFKKFESLNPERTIKMDEYSMMPFPLEGPGRYPNNRAGSHMKVLQNTFRCENLLLSAEAINAFSNVFLSEPLDNLEDSFMKLMGYESHCVYIVGNSKSYTLLSYYSIPYEGQITDLTYEDRGGIDLLNAENSAKGIIEKKTKTLIKSIPGELASKETSLGVIFNPLSYNYRKVIEIPYEKDYYPAVRNSFGEIIPIQEEKDKILFQMELPPLGLESFSLEKKKDDASTEHKSRVEVSNSSSSVGIENENLLVEIDKDTGCISQIYIKGQSYPLLKGKGMDFIIGSTSDIKTSPFEVKILEKGPVRAKILTKGILLRNDSMIGTFELLVSLEAQTKLVLFELHFDSLKPITGIPWLETLRVRFNLNLEEPKVYRSYLNVTEETHKNLYNSPYYTMLADKGRRISFLNDGPQFYIFRDNSLEFVLTGEQDYTRDFRWAIYLGEGFPLKASLAWQYLPIILMSTGNFSNNLPVRRSLLKCKEDNVIISGSIPTEDKSFNFHVYEISGKETTFTLCSDAIMRSAKILEGKNNLNLSPKENQISLTLNPWEFVTLNISFQD